MNDTFLQNIQEKCRACLVSIDYTLKSERVENGIEHPKALRNSLLSPDMCRLFLSFTTVDVRYELEDFPKQLCQLCADQLNEYEEFREKALASTRELYLSLKKSAISGEEQEIQRIKQERSYNDCSFYPNEMCAAIMDASGCNDGDENVSSDDQDSKGDIGGEENIGERHDSDDDSNNSPTNIQLMSPVYDRRSVSRGKDNVPNEGTHSDAGTTKDVDSKNPKLYCFICQRQFRVELYFKAHMLKVHEGVHKPFSCEKCSNSFKTCGQLTTHKDGNCGKPDILLKDNIQYNLIKPRGRKNTVSNEEFVCKLCARQLSNKQSLHLHMLRHQNSAKYQCTDCDVAKNTAYCLSVHMRVHKKRYKCPECDVEKITPYDLGLHMRVHNEKLDKFKCPQCPQLFTHKNLINRHIRVVHEGIKKYVCSHCPKRFGTHTMQLLHEKTTHAKGRYFCNICYRSFPVEKTFNNHLKKHNKIQCNLCPKRFMNIKTLADHQKVHLGDNPNVCSVCSHGFYNAVDLKLHVEQKHGVNNCNENGGENQNGPYEDEASQDNLTKSMKISGKRKAMGEVTATKENDSIDKSTIQTPAKSCKKATSKPLSTTNRFYKQENRSSARISNPKK